MTGAGIPEEWAEVERGAARVDKVDPGAIDEVARQFADASRDAGDRTADLTNAAAPLAEGGVWEGPAADAFFGYVTRVAEAGERVTGKLDEVAGELTALGETLAGIKDRIGDVVRDARTTIDDRNASAQERADTAASEMRAYDNGERDTPPAPTSAEIIRAAGEANSGTARAASDDIDGLLRQANEAIRSAQELMRTEIGGGFSDVAPPGQAGNRQTATGGIAPGGGASGAGG
ncbi:WXG100 family type VII secretion target, partial [Saccharomonospora iraqiensis]|uniref:WXG100 family type VII secretion target n=1 Tax=Saccharomonospora iraqiensis TaxID=52698 RepID=UPI00022E1988